MVSAWLYDQQMPFGWISCDAPLAIGEQISVSIQGEHESVNAPALVIDVDRREMQNRRAPVYLERGVTIPLPIQ